MNGVLPSKAVARIRRLALGAAGLSACGVGGEAREGGGPWFEERAAAAGLSFVHRSGHTVEFYTPEVVTGGVGLLDADEDGSLDVYLVQGGSVTAPPGTAPGNQLFRNRGDGTFEDVSAASGAGDRGYGIGAATGDADGDGHTDLYVTNLGPNALLRNDGRGRFTDVTAAAGVGDPGLGSSAAFADLDLDGDLDLYVANYLVWSVASEKDCYNGLGQRDYCAPALYNAPAVDVLYRNEGDGSFTDVSREAGLTSAFGTGLGVACGDFTGDGRPDVFVANDGRPNQLWVNLGGLRFEDRALRLGCAMDQDAVAKAGMGVAVGDLDDDGDLDLLVCNLRREADSLYRNEGGSFRDVTSLSGLGQLGRGFTRFGTGWVDLDNDGWLDLYQANGRVASEGDGQSSSDPLAEPNLLFRGLPGGRFEEVQPRGGTETRLVHTSRGCAFGDLDGDGAIDLVVANRDGAPYLLHNRVGGARNWLLVHVRNERGGEALGANVSLRLGPRTVHREVRTAYGYASASDPRVAFGLGSVASVEALEVRWPDGVRERVPVGPVNRVIEVRRGAERASPATDR